MALLDSEAEERQETGWATGPTRALKGHFGEDTVSLQWAARSWRVHHFVLLF